MDLDQARIARFRGLRRRLDRSPFPTSNHELNIKLDRYPALFEVLSKFLELNVDDLCDLMRES